MEYKGTILKTILWDVEILEIWITLKRLKLYLMYDVSSYNNYKNLSCAIVTYLKCINSNKICFWQSVRNCFKHFSFISTFVDHILSQNKRTLLYVSVTNINVQTASAKEVIGTQLRDFSHDYNSYTGPFFLMQTTVKFKWQYTA